MIERALMATAVACLLLGVASQAQQTTVRVRPGAAAAAPTRAQAKAVFLEACARCHPPERVTATRRTKAQWEETMNAMVTSRGATLTTDQFDTVLKYLVAEYGTATTSAGATGGAPATAVPPPPAGAPTATQTPATPRRRGAGGTAAGGATGTAAGGQTPAAAPPRPVQRGGAGPDDKHVVDAEAAMRGRTTYAAGCIQCHGTQARGGDRGANLVRSLVVLHDRYGSEIGPFLRKGHPTQAGSPDAANASTATFTEAQIVDLSHFLHERLNDTLRGSPIFTVHDVLIGDRQAGAAYFEGAGGCRQCHSPTGDLAGIGTRYDPPGIQQRFLFPRPPGRGPRPAVSGPAGGGPGGGTASPVPKQVTVSVTPSGGETVSGVLVHLDDFTVSLRDAAGQYRSWTRSAGLTVVKHDPYATHVALLDTLSDKNIHDVVAYLESLK
jgi:cytochrome c oxidase cbb3-type subunit 3